MRLRFLLLIALAVLPFGFARGQAVNFNDARLPITDLNGPWRFRPVRRKLRRLRVVTAFRW